MKTSVVAKVNDDHGFVACLTVVGDLLFGIGGTDYETTVLASSDGRHVHPCVAPDTTGLRSGIGDRSGRLWVVGEYGFIGVSDDQGLTWKSVASGTSGCLYDIKRNAKGELVVCGDDGFVATSKDGKKWKRLKLKGRANVGRIVSIDGEDFFLRGDGKVTIWDGKRATDVASGFKAPLTGLVKAKDDALWLVGDKGACATSIDRGRTWKKVKLPVKATWEAIARVGDELLIVGAGGHALLSKGATFRAIATRTFVHLWSICVVDGGAFIGGDRGLVLRIEESPSPIWAKRKDTLATRPGPDDRHFDGNLDQFLTTCFAAFLDTRGGDASELKAFEPVWGVKPPAGLVSLTKAMHKPKRELFEWSYEDGGLPNPPKKENLFERIVLRDQKNYLGTGLFEAFGGLHFIGYQGNGDYYWVEVFPKDGHQIIHFDHETFDSSTFADSANSFAVFTAACKAQEERRLSTATWKRITQYLKKRIDPSWHFEDVLEEAKLSYEGDSTAQQRIWRCRWLIYMFRQDGVVDMEDMPGLFDARFNPPLTEDLYRDVKSRIDKPPTALMFLWRAFFFDDKTWLDRMLAIARKSKSRLLRDAGLLVEELLGGRTKLGKIRDIHKLKKAFQAHDLDPAREKARAAEQKSAAKEEAKAKKTAASQVGKAVTRGDDVVELAWSTINDLGGHEAVWKTARSLPWMADAIKRLDWLAADSWHREARILSHEEEEVIEVFLDKLSDKAAALLVPLWVGDVLTDATEPMPTPKDEPWIEKGHRRVMWVRALRLLRDLARRKPIGPRAADALRPLLAMASRYEHKRQRVLWVLGAMKDRGSVDAIVKVIDAAKPTAGRHYMDFGSDEDLLKAAFWALEEIGDAKAGDAVLAKLTKWGKTAHRMNVYMARALRSVGDERAIDVFLDLSKRLHKENNHDKGVTEMLWSAAHLGAKASAAKKKAWAARLPPVTEYRDNINLARDLALRAFTGKEPASLAASVTKDLRDMPGPSSWEHGRVELALRALREIDLPGTLAVPYTQGEDLVLRKLAHETLAARGQIAKRVAFVDLFALEGESDDSLKRMLLDDRRLFRSRIVDHAVAKKRTALRPVIIERIRRLLKVLPTDQRDLAVEHDYALFWAVKGLVTFGLDDASRAVFNDLLKHPNRNVKDPVLRFAPLDRGLEPGMKHVLDEAWAWQAKAAHEWLTKRKR